jgi:hypothetical protein
VLKLGVIVLVVLILLLGLPLGMPMPGTTMCPDCDGLGAWSVVCIALLGSVVLLVQRRATRFLVDGSRRPIFVSAEVRERPPRISS